MKKASVWKIRIVPENFDTIQSSNVLHSLHYLLVAVLAMPANGSAQANHTKNAKHNRLLLSWVVSSMHTFASSQMTSVWKPFVRRESLTSIKKSPLAFSKWLKTSDFLSFALIHISNKQTFHTYAGSTQTIPGRRQLKHTTFLRRGFDGALWQRRSSCRLGCGVEVKCSTPIPSFQKFPNRTP